MATKRMLIDSAHPEETRVAVLNGNRLDELDVESAARQQLKGNIYLAKVTRVEPSLQAAFVDYGGNRHGFLAFSEIHPDYYQIPVADREQLLAEHNAAQGEETDDGDDTADGQDGESKAVETIGGDDIDEVEERRPTRHVRKYKVQEVVKRRQILLVQVVKEERGNKGAALTTYLSLAGRYCVLMPNTGRGGGISRKISSGQDRKRLKTIISDFDIPEGIAVIVRTAGADRGKAELKRDYGYLIRLWDEIRELTLKSTAPALIHEEANIINRAIRDLYSRDIEDIQIEGETGYRMAKDLMKLLIPSHAKKVQRYRDTVVPIFHRFGVENQMVAMNRQDVQLKSGGYIVINPTEALVAIDVNSGRSTRGRNIEETALKTNMEAAAEVSRQLRLRDLAGLIVIDFIDMEHNRNQTAVERCLKENMRNDRARIQIGRISPFGLLELSRQRLRPSLTETISDVCPHCDGTGIRRSTESSALHVLRGIEEEGAGAPGRDIEVAIPGEVALYLLNHKRQTVTDIEAKFELTINLTEDNSLIPPDFKIARSKGGRPAPETVKDDDQDSERDDRGNGDDDGKRKKRWRSRRRKRGEETVEATEETVSEELASEPGEAAVEPDDSAGEAATTNEAETERAPNRRRGRRGGRRHTRKAEDTTATNENEAAAASAPSDGEPVASESPSELISGTPDNGSDSESAEKPKPARRRRTRKPAADKSAGANENADLAADTGDGANAQVGPSPDSGEDAARAIETPVAVDEAAPEPLAAAPAPAPVKAERGVTVTGNEPEPEPGEAAKSRRGWWQKGAD